MSRTLLIANRLERIDAGHRSARCLAGRPARVLVAALALVAASAIGPLELAHWTAAAQEVTEPTPTRPADAGTNDLPGPDDDSAAPATQPATTVPSTAPAGPVPIFECDQLLYEFPEVWSGETVEHTWIIHDQGDAPLRILEVKPDCGCTAADYDKEIPPGGQGKLTARLSTKGLSHGGEKSTEVTKSISVRTNDPKAAQIALRLKGKVKARISMEPPNGAQFPQGTPAGDLTQTITLTNNTDRPLKIDLAPTPVQAPFTCDVQEIEPGKVYQLIVTPDKSRLKEGPNAAQIHLKTGFPEEPDFFVPASLYIPPIIQVTPGTLNVATPIKVPFHREITLIHNRPGPMNITAASASDPAIKVKVQKLEAPKPTGRVWKLIVEIPSGWNPPQPAPAPVEITVQTDVKERPQIKVPIRIFSQVPKPKAPGTAPGGMNQATPLPGATRRLGFALIPTLDGPDGDERPAADVTARLVNNLEANGPHSAQANTNGHRWFDAQCNLPPHSIMAMHAGQTYVLLPASGPATLLPANGAEGIWLQDVRAAKDTLGHPVVALTLDPETAAKFRGFTRANIGKPLAIILDDQVVSQAVIRSEMSQWVQISGNFTQQQVEEIVAELAGAKRAVPTSEPSAPATPVPYPANRPPLAPPPAQPPLHPSRTRMRPPPESPPSTSASSTRTPVSLWPRWVCASRSATRTAWA
jgi:hypothetical protein